MRLGEVLNFTNGDRGKNYPSKDKLSDKGEIPFISSFNVKEETIRTDNLLYVSQDQFGLLVNGS